MADNRSSGRLGTCRREKPARAFALRLVVGCRACGAESAASRVASFFRLRVRDGCRGNVDACAGMARDDVAVSDRSRSRRSDRGDRNVGRRVAAEFRLGGRAGSSGFAVRPSGARGRICRFFPAGPLAESVAGPVADRRPMGNGFRGTNFFPSVWPTRCLSSRNGRTGSVRERSARAISG